MNKTIAVCAIAVGLSLFAAGTPAEAGGCTTFVLATPAYCNPTFVASRGYYPARYTARSITRAGSIPMSRKSVAFDRAHGRTAFASPQATVRRSSAATVSRCTPKYGTIKVIVIAD